MQFKAVLSQETLKTITSAISTIVSEAKIQILPTGLKIQAVDPATVCMAFVEVGADAFDFYKADEGMIALDLPRLASFAEGKEPVTLELDPDTHKLKISTGKAKYSMSLLDPSSIKDTPRLPQLDMPCSVSIPGSELQASIKACMKVCDHVIIAQEEDFSFEAKGDIDAVKIVYPLAELTGIKQGTSRSLFSLDYMEDIAKIAGKAAAVKVDSGIDYPGVFSCDIGKVHIRYFVAPRMEQSE